jgi:hypothetical protein
MSAILHQIGTSRSGGGNNMHLRSGLLLQAVSEDELPEELLGAVRLSRLQFSSALEVEPLQ